MMISMLIEFAIDDAWQGSVQEIPFVLINMNCGQHPLNAFNLDTDSSVLTL